MLRNHCRKDTASYVKLGGKSKVSRLEGGNQVIHNAVGYGLMECAFVTVRPDVELEAFKLYAFFFRDVIENQRGEIRLPGFWAQAGELRDFHMDEVIPAWGRVREYFQFFRRDTGRGTGRGTGRSTGHSLISVISVRMACSGYLFQEPISSFLGLHILGRIL
jgi:hypothetical protein